MNNGIEYQELEGVVSISLNRPPANAYTLEYQKELNVAIRRAEAAHGVNAVVIDSKLEKFFCAGADIKAFQRNSVADNNRMVEQARENLLLLETSPKIYIAAISGHCMGGGLEIALACDFRFAADDSFLVALPEIKLGLMPGNGGSQRLTKLIGIRHALELLVTGDSISPQRACEIGLFNRVLPRNELLDHCLEFGRSLSRGAGLAIAATKRAVYQGATMALPDALKLESELVESLYHTEDAKEGFLASVEKRAPLFKGN